MPYTAKKFVYGLGHRVETIHKTHTRVGVTIVCSPQFSACVTRSSLLVGKPLSHSSSQVYVPPILTISELSTINYYEYHAIHLLLP